MYLSTSTFDAASYPFFTPAPLSRASALSTFEDLLTYSKGDSQLQRWSSLIGIITAIVGNILISFALNIQRYAHIKLHEERVERREKSRNTGTRPQNGYGTTDGSASNGGDNGHENGEADDPLQRSNHSADSQSTSYSDNDHDHDSSYLKSPYWWGGIVLMTIGEAGNFLAYGFAPASIVSPLGVVGLISNCVIAPIMLKEQFRMRDFWGVVVAVAGAVTVVLSAKQQEKKLGPHEILSAITSLEFEVYMAVTITLIVILIWASPRYGNKTILVDLGLVGLFGRRQIATSQTLLTISRSLHGSFHERCFVYAFIYTMESSCNTSHLRPTSYIDWYRNHASQIRQQGIATIRLDAGNSGPICHVYSLGHYRKCSLVS
jgi:hypothetical protein